MLTLYQTQPTIGGIMSNDTIPDMDMPTFSPTDTLSGSQSSELKNNPRQQDWADHKDIIIDLYLKDWKPLRVVVETMKTKYGFEATERMYKARLKLWGAVKNEPRAEKKKGISKPVPSTRRRGSSTSQLETKGLRPRGASHSSTSPLESQEAVLVELAPAIGPITPIKDESMEEELELGLELATNSQLVAKYISAPDQDLYLQGILTHINRYYLSCFSGQRSQFSPPDIGTLSFNRLKIDDDEVTDRGLLTLHDPGFAAISLAKSHQYREATYLLGDAFDKLNSLLRVQHPTLLPFLLEVICEDSTTPEFNVSERFRSFAHELSGVIKGNDHSLTLILSLLGRVDHRLDTCAMILQRIQDLLGAEFGASKWEARRPVKVYCRVLRHLGRYDEVEQILDATLHNYDNLDMPTQSELLGLLYESAWLHARGHKDFGAATDYFMDILRRTGKDAHLTQVSHFRVKAWRGLGVLASENQHYGRSLEYFKAALTESQRGFGRRDSNTIRISSELEASLRHLNRVDEADELKKERDELFVPEEPAIEEMRTEEA